MRKKRNTLTGGIGTQRHTDSNVLVKPNNWTCVTDQWEREKEERGMVGGSFVWESEWEIVSSLGALKFDLGMGKVKWSIIVCRHTSKTFQTSGEKEKKKHFSTDSKSLLHRNLDLARLIAENRLRSSAAVRDQMWPLGSWEWVIALIEQSAFGFQDGRKDH